MDKRALKYFVIAFEEQNLTAAARRANVAQPSISAAISGLETDLSEQLFHRHKKGVTPTDAAMTLYPMAQDILNRMEAMRNHFREPANTLKLTIALQTSIDRARVERLLKRLKDNEDRLELRLVGMDEDADVRLISGSASKAGEQFLPLWSEDYVLVISANHPLSLKNNLSLADVHGLPVIHRSYCENRMLWENYSNYDVEIAAHANSEEWAVSLVAAGIGIAFMPEGCVGSYQGVVTKKLAEVNLSRDIGFAISNHTALPIDLKTFTLNF